jgi:hypothetical protein
MTMLPPESLDERPAVAGGSLFRTHRVVEAGERLELVPSSTVRGVVIGLSIFAPASLAAGALFAQRHADPGLLIVGIMLSLTSGVLALLLRRLLNHRHVFDRAAGRYVGTLAKVELPLAEIVGLQIVEKTVHGPESDYPCWELNLVLAQGRRVNVLSHADAPTLDADARTLARWLDVPMWGAAK